MNQPYYPYLMQYQPQPVQNSFLTVRSEKEARDYPIAPGNSITFRDENAPYIYTKTMGMSQLDRPHFEKFRLVREGEVTEREDTNISSLVSEIGTINETIKAMNEQIEALKRRIPNKPKRQIQEVDDDE